MSAYFVNVVISSPAYSAIHTPLCYSFTTGLPAGSVVRVPLGRREVLGVVIGPGEPEDVHEKAQIKSVIEVFSELPPLSAHWLAFAKFAADYYQRSWGEVALSSLPAELREATAEQITKRLNKLRLTLPEQAPASATQLNTEQTEAVTQIQSQDGPFLLFGATGSGKTEVYLHSVQACLDADPQAQALVMVPEINLTPQLQERFMARLGHVGVVALHSGLTPVQRMKNWLAAHTGRARVVLGTRMGVFASLPHLKIIVVDEEHDPSYKQQEGARYCARDLSVYRGRLEGAKVILGSATPSLESWRACLRGRYVKLEMRERIAGAALPTVRLVNMRDQPSRTVFAPTLLEAIQERVAREEQSLIFLNRRGYAPALACGSCGWKSDCRNCSAYRVFHKIDRTLRCHHCGWTERVPRACPECGNLDIAPLGRGTERIEEHLGELLSAVQRPDGSPVRIMRVDADTSRRKGALEEQLASVHRGEVDILVGTQMLTKGHDFRRITLVAALQADSALFSSDFRAPERLFSLLMQAAGRAGRDAAQGGAEMWVQTGYPQHPLFTALQKHDYPLFATQQLEEREIAGLPPFGFQALVRAQARSQELAQSFLETVRAAAVGVDYADLVTIYPAVPMSMERLANVERAQMLVESASRPALQRFLRAWHEVLRETKLPGVMRWAVDVDPPTI